MHYPDGFLEPLIKPVRQFAVGKNGDVKMTQSLEHDTIYFKPQNILRNNLDMEKVYEGNFPFALLPSLTPSLFVVFAQKLQVF